MEKQVGKEGIGTATSGLENLAKLLNFDFNGGDSSALEELRKARPPWIILDGESEALQKDLRRLVLPIISTAEVTADDAFNRLSLLLKSLNKKDLQTKWALVPETWDDIADSP